MTFLQGLRSVLLCALGMASASGAHAQNPVTDWDAYTLAAVVSVAKKSPAVAPVYFAYVNVAMFDAVNSVDHRHHPFAVSVRAPRFGSARCRAHRRCQ